jgi:ArsR family transcriptional regulator
METDQIVGALGALAQSTRLEIFRLLVKAGPAGLPAGGISRELGVVASTLSHHLGLLEQAGLARSTRQGRNVIYTCDVEGTRRMLTYLTQDCCDGKPELCGDLGHAAIGAAAG